MAETPSAYRVLADTADDHIFVIDRDDRVQYVNPAAARQFGAAPAELIGRRRTELFPPEVAERQGQNLSRVLTTGTSLLVEGRTLYRDQEVWLSTWLTPLRGDDGEVVAVLGVSRDITERKRLEDELRLADQRRRVVFSHVPLVVWTADRTSVVTFCAGLESAGFAADDVVGRTFADLHEEPFPSLRAPLQRALAGESVNRKVATGERTFETWSTPLRNPRGEITGATGCMVDITERLRLEADLANAQKLEAIGRLAGGIAHDFNNNLTAILGYVELIAGHAAAGDGTAIAGHVGEVRRAAERSADLVRRLLAFGRRQVLQPRTLDLNDVLNGLRPMLERLLGERIRVEVRTTTPLPPVSADAGELEQVIMNLALNARDAMPDGGTLTLETSAVAVPAGSRPELKEGRYALVRVGDTGAGMPPHVRERAFEPFFTTKPPGQGTGLGLSSVYGIVQQLDGAVAVESEVGRGTTVDVYLPAVLDPPPEEPAAPAPVPELPATGVTVLLVEDEDLVRRFARLALEHHGFRVVEAATPQEALEHGRSDGSIALLLTDVVMPRMNGPELADHLRRARPDLPVLFMSGYPSSLVTPRGTIEKSVQLLSKPFTTAQLIAAVRTALRIGEGGRP